MNQLIKSEDNEKLEILISEVKKYTLSLPKKENGLGKEEIKSLGTVSRMTLMFSILNAIREVNPTMTSFYIGDLQAVFDAIIALHRRNSF